MKTLHNYTESAQTALFNETGVFFAFSESQVKEKRQPNIKYSFLGNGLFVMSEHADKLLKGLDSIRKNGIEQDIRENGKKAIIKRELFNHECFYVSDITDCVEALTDYGIEEDEIKKVFRETIESGEADI